MRIGERLSGRHESALLYGRWQIESAILKAVLDLEIRIAHTATQFYKYPLWKITRNPLLSNLQSK